MKKLYFLLSFAMFSLLANAQEPFITTWMVNEGDLTIEVPVVYDSENNYTIDFGDGTILTNQTGPVSHTYENTEDYTVTISGNIGRVDFSTTPITSMTRLASIQQWGSIQWTSMENAFSGCGYLDVAATDTPDLSQATSLKGMFKYVYGSLNETINNWDVSNITDMSEMFMDAQNFNYPINNWDVSNVTNMSSMFNNAVNFNQSINDWDTSSVTNMSGMFKNTHYFNSPISNWDVSNVTNMSEMFKGAYYFNKPINNWDTSNVTDMSSMFMLTHFFNQPLDNWDVSSVTNMSAMFRECPFNQPIENWDVSNVTNMSSMFITCAFNQPIDSWDVSNVTDMSYMFRSNQVFNQPLNNWDISNVLDLHGIFTSTSNFNQDLSSWSFNPAVTLDTSTTIAGFISFSGMDITNCDALLLRFAQLGITNKILQLSGLNYCNQTVYNYLDNQLSWNIIGGDLGEGCLGNTISGNIIFDGDNNGCSVDDPVANNFLVSATDGQVTNATISLNGVYDLNVMEGSYTVQLLNVPDYYTATPATATIDFTGFDNEQELNFCLTANEQVADLNITVLPLNEARPGFTSQYRLLVHNIGTQTMNDVYASFSYNEEIQQFSEASQETSSATDNELTFSLGSISPFESKFVDITMETFAPPTVEGGEIISFNATVTPNTNDNTPNDNSFSFNQPVVNSFDPNDKKVVQGEEIYIEEAGEYLDYIIRFQNTGSASAITVRIEDVLHENLDWNTFTPITASHNYRVEITDGNQVSFIFDDIYLPHEDADEEGSHGFVAYKIKPVQDIEIGDMITGTAGIYFDYNLPIITNSANTEVIELLGLNDFSLNSITVYPNPAKSILNIQTDGNTIIENINIYNIEGREILNVKEQTESINIQNLSEGVYFMNIQTNKGISKHKLIKN
ncbi:BspA family leucine-rich repeat surface protein [Flavobacterium rakeshii]|uniref:BspA family leucine-rich repeat surface protein n=1 Tax=Flavobacterium rakeshii TaxID=1038845 RepID=UPI002E7B5041|nr:BspA family leucine-rich repeat surface protein [Flavobacterium rakeshii]MEE1897876.1 BspA family leucine-rich repeat surface protein [Flavobacterium rakeshii]